MNKTEIYIKLVSLFKYFDNNHHILAKYLLDNNSFNEDFLEKINKSDFLKNPNNEKSKFKNITEIDSFLFSILFQHESDKGLLEKLNSHIEKEEYEKAAKLRDYILKKK